jgi:hypothetical protein
MKYRLEVTRIAYARQWWVAEADSIANAKTIALQQAPEEEFSTYQSEYEVSSVEVAREDATDQCVNAPDTGPLSSAS